MELGHVTPIGGVGNSCIHLESDWTDVAGCWRRTGRQRASRRRRGGELRKVGVRLLAQGSIDVEQRGRVGAACWWVGPEWQ